MYMFVFFCSPFILKYKINKILEMLLELNSLLIQHDLLSPGMTTLYCSTSFQQVDGAGE